jgi:hypothetical protein
MSPVTRRDLLADVAMVVSGIGINVLAGPAARWPFRLLGLAALLWCISTLVRDLRRYDDQRHGTFDLLVACEHTPDGARLDGLTRSELWRVLRRLDPEHHLVWVDGKPLDVERGKWRA